MTSESAICRIGDGKGWAFVNGPWADGEAGELVAPRDELWTTLTEHLAVVTDRAYTDVEATFEFRRDHGTCGIGMIVRAQDAGRFYAVEIPHTGQQIREGHLRGVITRRDQTGWGKVLMQARAPGAPGEALVWNSARIVVAGNTIQLFVNGRPLPPVEDDVYPMSGFVGIMNWGYFSIRNVRINGKEAAGLSWDESIHPARPWFHPYPNSDDHQGTAGPARAPNGDFLMLVNDSLTRSTDQGQTWQQLGTVESSDTLGPGVLAATPDGRMIRTRVHTRKPFIIELSDSPDNGQTWSPFEQVGQMKLHDAIPEAYMYGQILELQDGGLLYFGYTHPPNYELVVENVVRYRQGPVPGMMNFCIRSDDGGRTWADPVDIDGHTPGDTPFWMSFKDQASEVSAIETKEGQVVAFLRPGTAWAVWETRSDDGGRTWTPMSSGPFLSYACAAPPRATASGALVVGGRFPALAIQVSRDNGMTWETYRIDTEGRAMGGMYEVAPDVVFWAYGSGAQQLRGQLIHITPTGVEPLAHGAETLS